MNMNSIMAQAQKMQKDIQKKQEEINNTTFVGESEWVKITMKGDKKIEKVEIKNKSSMDSEDLECLEDMIKLALDDALNKIDKEINDKMGMYSKLAGGLF